MIRLGTLSRSLRMAGILLGTFLMAFSSNAQLNFSGQASTAIIKSDAQQSQYIYNGGRSTFNWRLDLFTDALVSENITFQSNIRILQDQALRVDLFSIKISNVSPLNLSLEAGEIELPVGNLGSRRFPMKNPFVNLPLMHEHYTSLRYPDYQIWPFDTRFTVAGNGVRLLDRGLYDLGFKVSGSEGIVDYAFAIINGTVSVTSVYANQGLNANDRFGVIFRLALTPMTGLTIGGSYSDGQVNVSQSSGTYTGSGNSVFRQHLLEGDVEFSVGHFALYGEAIYNIWKFDQLYGDGLTAWGYSLEGSYTVFPRCTISGRAGGVFFGTVEANVQDPSYSTIYYYNGRWDHDVVRFEVAAGYRLTRESQLKFAYRWNNIISLLSGPIEQLGAIQAVVSF